MPYVQRKDGIVVGVFENPQPDFAEEWLEENHPDLNRPESPEQIWQKIKAERDTRKAGGVKVVVSGDDKWFHSDDGSRIQQLGLVMMGASVPPVEWKTMDGSFVTMSQLLAGAIFQAVAAHDVAVFGVAENHRIAMENSEDPSSYDYSTDWPQTFAEWQAAQV